MGELWWQQISNARRFIETVIGSVKDGKNIILYLPETMPYMDTFHQVVEDKLRENFAQKTLKEIDLCFEEITNVGEYMLQSFCKKAKRLQYRGTKTIGAFLGQSEDIVFHERCFWVHNIPVEKLEEWVQFINDYSQNLKPELSPAVFILDCEDEAQLKAARGTVVPVSFNASISDYDKYAFCTIIAAENSCKHSMRDYLGQLASSCCSDDVEFAALCVDAGQEFLSDPIGTMYRVTDGIYRSNGKPFDIKSPEVIKEKIWTAQVRTLFPVIESARIKLINAYKEQLISILKSKDMKNASGASIESPYDVEIGTMVYMVGKHQLYLPSSEYEKLDLLRTVRNNLAHINITEYALVDRIMALKANL